MGRLTRFVVHLDRYVARTAQSDPHEPRLPELSAALRNARELLAFAEAAQATTSSS
jgi:hypothetical protein